MLSYLPHLEGFFPDQIGFLYAGEDPGFLDPGFRKGGGGILGLQAKQGGGAGGGPTLGPVLKSIQRGQRGEGSGPPGPLLDPPMICMVAFK